MRNQYQSNDQLNLTCSQTTSPLGVSGDNTFLRQQQQPFNYSQSCFLNHDQQNSLLTNGNYKTNNEFNHFIRSIVKEEFVTLILPYHQKTNNQIIILDEKIKMINTNNMLLYSAQQGRNNTATIPKNIYDNININNNDTKIKEIEENIKKLSDKIETYSNQLNLIQNTNHSNNNNTKVIDNQTQTLLNNFELQLSSFEQELNTIKNQLPKITSLLLKQNSNEFNNVNVNELNNLKLDINRIQNEMNLFKSTITSKQNQKEIDNQSIPEEITNNNNQISSELLEQIKQIDPKQIEENNKIILSKMEEISRQNKQFNMNLNEIKSKHDKDFTELRNSFDQLQRTMLESVNPNEIQFMNNKLNDFSSRLLSVEDSVFKTEKATNDILTKSIFNTELSKIFNDLQEYDKRIENIEEQISLQHEENDNQFSAIKIQNENELMQLNDNIKILQNEIQNLQNNIQLPKNLQTLTFGQNNLQEKQSIINSVNDINKNLSENQLPSYNQSSNHRGSPFNSSEKDNNVQRKPSNRVMRTNLIELLENKESNNIDTNKSKESYNEPNQENDLDNYLFKQSGYELHTNPPLFNLTSHQEPKKENPFEQEDGSPDDFDDDSDEFRVDDLQ